MALRCLIVDDSTAFARSARALLEQEGIEVVGVASTAAEAMARASELRPDVLLLDIDLGDESGFDVARRLQRSTILSPSKVILISSHSEEDFADLVDTAPAAGFLSKADLSASAIDGVLRRQGDGDPSS